MTNIQTLAYNSKKPKKKEAQEIIEQLYKSANENTRQELAAIYKYFQPAPVKKPKSPLQWLGLALGKEEVRPYLHFIWVDGKGNAVATNGHILLRYTDYKCKEGFYDTEGHKIEHDFTFPQWERVIPEYFPEHEISLDSLEIDEKGDYVLKDCTSHGFNKTLIDQALSYGSDIKAAYWSKDGTAMRIDFKDHRQAVIMPLRKGM